MHLVGGDDGRSWSHSPTTTHTVTLQHHLEGMLILLIKATIFRILSVLITEDQWYNTNLLCFYHPFLLCSVLSDDPQKLSQDYVVDGVPNEQNQCIECSMNNDKTYSFYIKGLLTTHCIKKTDCTMMGLTLENQRQALRHWPQGRNVQYFWKPTVFRIICLGPFYCSSQIFS